jgi:hypothetical protein
MFDFTANLKGLMKITGSEADGAGSPSQPLRDADIDPRSASIGGVRPDGQKSSRATQLYTFGPDNGQSIYNEDWENLEEKTMTQLLGLTPETQKRGPLVVYPNCMGWRLRAAAGVVLAAGLAAELVPDALAASGATAAVVFSVTDRLFSQELSNDSGKVDTATSLNFDTLLQRRIDAVKRVLPLLNPESKAIDINFGPEFSVGFLSGQTPSIRQLMAFQTVYGYWLNPTPFTRPTLQQTAQARAAIKLLEMPGFGIEGVLLSRVAGRAAYLLADQAEVARRRHSMVGDVITAAGLKFDKSATLIDQARTLMKAVGILTRQLTQQRVWPTSALDWYSLDGQNFGPDSKGFNFFKRISTEPVTATSGVWDGNLVFGKSAARADDLSKALFARMNLASEVVDPNNHDTQSIEKLAGQPLTYDTRKRAFVEEELGHGALSLFDRDPDPTLRATAVLRDASLWWLTLEVGESLGRSSGLYK